MFRPLSTVPKLLRSLAVLLTRRMKSTGSMELKSLCSCSSMQVSVLVLRGLNAAQNHYQLNGLVQPTCFGGSSSHGIQYQ